MMFWYLLAVFVLACFIGYFVVWGVTPALHAPLMSVSNAISGIVIIGALMGAAYAKTFEIETLSLAAVFLSAVNIFGGFAITQRMLGLFKKKDKK